MYVFIFFVGSSNSRCQDPPLIPKEKVGTKETLVTQGKGWWKEVAVGKGRKSIEHQQKIREGMTKFKCLGEAQLHGGRKSKDDKERK